MRKPWYQHWMEEAEHASEMSTCAAGRKVGAVFVRDNRVLTTGFNGVPAGYPHPEVCARREANVPSGEKLEMCGCAHAEANGIANAAREGIALKGAALYCTTEPCTICMGALANVGISEVYFDKPYPHKMSRDIAKHAGISVFKMEVSNEPR
jgi:dCMP deaminase